jgi:hypothetical protein
MAGGLELGTYWSVVRFLDPGTYVPGTKGDLESNAFGTTELLVTPIVKFCL